MSVIDHLKGVEKRLNETMDGVLAEQIGTNSRIDDLDHQIGDVRDLLLRVLSLLESEDDAPGGASAS